MRTPARLLVVAPLRRSISTSRLAALLCLGLAVAGADTPATAQLPDLLEPWLAPQEWERDTDAPVLELGGAGAFDDTHIFAPAVAVEKDRFLMWYCGSRGFAHDLSPTRTRDERVFELGLATSEDGKRFERHAGGSVYALERKGLSILTPTILRDADGSVLREDGLMRMWFCSATLGGRGQVQSIQHATSASGVEWSRPSPVLLERAYAPSVIKTEKGYEMWYTVPGPYPWVMRHARSRDGLEWKVTEKPVMEISQDWEHYLQIYPAVCRIDGVYLMWYASYLSADRQTTAIGFAASLDGVSWHKHPQNPVLRPAPERAWESHYVSSQSVVRLSDGSFRMWYASRKKPPFHNLYFALNTARWSGPRSAKERVKTPAAGAPQDRRPYRLDSVDLKRRVIWGAECRQPEGSGLAFGGQDQEADDGRPHTRLLVDGEWKAIHDQLRASNPLQELHDRIWRLRREAQGLRARARKIYFKGLPPAEEAARVEREVAGDLSRLKEAIGALVPDLRVDRDDDYASEQASAAGLRLQAARKHSPAIDSGIRPGTLRSLWQLQIELELAAEMLDAEPPPRAMDCGRARRPDRQSAPASDTLVQDPKTGLYLLFGGDHLDYLSNDTWVFDPRRRRWFQRHPRSAPPPRANHRLVAVGDGTIRMTGGYTYSSNTDYLGGQYIDLDDGEWLYDIEKDAWSGGELVSPDSRVYRSGPFHPDFYSQDPKPDAAKFESWLRELPANEWLATDPPYLPRLNRDWGTARIDPDGDRILRWSGGHSAHGGSDVLHFHFSTNRWELPFPVEFPLGQLYSNTSYPNGFNFNLRPWMTGHSYQNYDYDPPGKVMIKAGRPHHFYVYDPELGDWIGRGAKPAAMQYGSCFYTLTLTATPRGIVCWDKNGRVHRYDHGEGKWIELNLSGEKLPGAYVDNSSIAHDSKRDRVLILNTLGYQKPFDGQVWALDLATGEVRSLSPRGREHADRFANVDKCCYDPTHDLLLLGTYLGDAGDHTPTPAYDCAENRWVTLDIGYDTEKRSQVTRRKFPHRRSDALVHDPRRKLIWGTDTNSQVYVLRLEPESAGMKPLR